MEISLDIGALSRMYQSGRTTPTYIIQRVYESIFTGGVRPTWITLTPVEDALERAERLQAGGPGKLPLYGIPFAVKDNIDVRGLPTTAGCPAYAYKPDRSAAVVEKLEAAGAILVGKTNMDQFATGLSGARSPYGACQSAFDPQYISGGSSSGSAVAVARGLVSFALGTDTAGSGRVPAAFNNVIGLKPTRGLISMAGVVPACRSLDCLSVFALTSADAAGVLSAVRGFDACDPFSRPSEERATPWLAGRFRAGIPRPGQLQFFGDAEAASSFEAAVRALERVGADIVDIDFDPFRTAAELLYAGPWVAERFTAIKQFFEAHQNDMHPVVRAIVAGAAKYSAADLFESQYQLERLRRTTAKTWNEIDLMLLPTTGTAYTIEQMLADPVQLNTNLGYYTNFVNLLDLVAVAVPSGFKQNGIPFGVSVIGSAFTETALLTVADRLHRAMGSHLGATGTELITTAALSAPVPPPGCTLVAVVGAHLSGQPLNRQLIERDARLVRCTRTAADYRLYALAGTVPAKPGLVYEPGAGGSAIEVEVWAMPTPHFGSFVQLIPPPLGIGTIRLEDGTAVNGFICESFAIPDAIEITAHGGWRNYLAARV